MARVLEGGSPQWLALTDLTQPPGPRLVPPLLSVAPMVLTICPGHTMGPGGLGQKVGKRTGKAFGPAWSLADLCSTHFTVAWDRLPSSALRALGRGQARV